MNLSESRTVFFNMLCFSEKSTDNVLHIQVNEALLHHYFNHFLYMDIRLNF